jgi:isoleucyl-tRNA synthetase
MSETQPPHTTTKPDYKNTVFLPHTDFPMKAGLPQAEPKWLALWDKLDLYARLRAESKGRPTFILHDGPPYANGHVHVGTAMTKVMKDACVRYMQMAGHDAHWTPGWDCHGLPIEWKVEEKYRAAGKNKDDVPIAEFRAECLEFANHWVGVQMAEFKRTGALADWKNYYATTSLPAERAIVGEIHKFLMNGGLYRGVKPVMWSTVEKTALAEAEVEYHDHVSTTAYVAFPVVKASTFDIKGADIVIWTTTPWTLPANRAIAYGDEIDYVVVSAAGRIYVVAQALLETFIKAAELTDCQTITTLKGSQLAGTICAHPLRGPSGDMGYEFDVPLLAGDFVTTETGTGFVHIAPSHGMDDYKLGLVHKLPMPEMVEDDGRYAASVPLFAGTYIYTPEGKPGPANKTVLEAISGTGLLVATDKLKHSYPHSWRSKAPVIFRATPQWFISMDTNQLRDKALQAIADTRWLPPARINRIRSMVEARPDWNISRQRTWGVPLGIFMNKKTLEPLRDEDVCRRIQDIFGAEGAGAWFTRPVQDFLGDRYNPADYEQIMDVVDVWFESGCTHVFTIENDPSQPWPADVYWESSDQHRGWFQSSLLESCGTRGRAPYKTVVTNGFVNDAKGYKMSKSVGNVINAQELIDEFGADIFRLWLFTVDYTEDMRAGREFLQKTSDLYRKLRNTLRYLLGNLHGFDESERVATADMPELERYILCLLAGVDGKIRAAMETYDFSAAVSAIQNFCTNDLSAFYFDIRKDALYCDATDSLRRRACRTVLDTLYTYLTAWLAPFLCFTAEEAWQLRGATDAVPSVHLRTFPTVPAEWKNNTLSDKWEKVRAIRTEVTSVLEPARERKEIGSSLQADAFIQVIPEIHTLVSDINFAEVCITSRFKLTTDGHKGFGDYAAQRGFSAGYSIAEGAKCDRCWQVLPEVGSHADHPTLCTRCHGVVTRSAKAAA